MPPFSYAFPLPAVSIPIANMDGTPSWDILFSAQAGIAICFLQQTHRRFLWTCQRDFSDPFSFACQAIQEAVRGSSRLNIFFQFQKFIVRASWSSSFKLEKSLYGFRHQIINRIKIWIATQLDKEAICCLSKATFVAAVSSLGGTLPMGNT